MLYDEKAVRDNIRNREGRRVFYLGKGDQLNSGARDFLTRQRIEILPAELARPRSWRLESGGTLEEKPEGLTHLNAETLVEKTHPRIRFRGKMDTLEAVLIQAQLASPAASRKLGEILSLARRLIRCDVLEEPVGDITLFGMNAEKQREISHFPQKFYGIPHFMPEAADGPEIAWVNRARCAAREAELAAVEAFPDRGDILKALNRMSSLLYILMIEMKAGKL